MNSFYDTDWRKIDFPDYVPAPVQQYIQQVIQDLPTISVEYPGMVDDEPKQYKVDLQDDQIVLRKLRIPKYVPEEIKEFFLEGIAGLCGVIAARAATYRRFHKQVKCQKQLNERQLSFKQALDQDLQLAKDLLCHYFLYLLYKCGVRIWTKTFKSIQGLRAELLPKLKQCSLEDLGIDTNNTICFGPGEHYLTNRSIPTVDEIVDSLDQLFSYCFFLAAKLSFEEIHAYCKTNQKSFDVDKVSQPFRKFLQELKVLQTKIIKQINAKQITELSKSLKRLHRDYLYPYLDDSHLIIVDGLELDKLADRLPTRPKEKQAQILKELSIKIEELQIWTPQPLQEAIQGRQNNTKPILIRIFVNQVRRLLNEEKFHLRQQRDRDIFSILFNDKQSKPTKKLFYHVAATMTDLLVRSPLLSPSLQTVQNPPLNQIIKADDVRRILEAKKK